MKDAFVLVGRRPPSPGEPAGPTPRRSPSASAILLSMILLGCLFFPLISSKDPSYMDLQNCAAAPSREFLFGTDTMGRDIFSMIWYGGRLSLFIGAAASLISAAIAVVFGAVSGCAPPWLDALLMRLTEIFLSVPNLLMIVLLQAVLGQANVLSLSFVIGITSWTSIAKVVRTQVRQIRDNEFILAAKCMGGGFFYLLRRHLAPNFASSILFMVVMNVRGAIAAESTLSFLGIGLPLEVITWGSMLSLGEKALLSGAWWIILIPGGFLAATLICITNLGSSLQNATGSKESNL